MNDMVSVIITCYNKEKYISKCIDSVISQNYKNLEIIIIDDGSKDSSAKIIEKYKNSYKNIKIIIKENEGVSKTRNLGIKLANGNKIIFIDGDDYVTKEYIEELMKYKNNDLVICGYNQFSEKSVLENKPLKQEVYINKQIVDILLNKKYMIYTAVPYLKLFSLDIIKNNNISFNEEMNYGEDIAFVFDYLMYTNTLKIVDKCLYCNRIVEGTLSRKYVKNMDNQLYEVYLKGKKLYNNKLNSTLNYLYMRNLKLILLNETNLGYKKYKEKAKEILNTNYFKEQKKLKKRLKDKLLYILLRLRMFFITYKIIKNV